MHGPPPDGARSGVARQATVDVREQRSRFLLPRFSGDVRVAALVVAMVAATGGFYVALVEGGMPLKVPIHLSVWVLAGMFAVAEAFVVHVQLKREAISFSLSEIPLVLGLFFADVDALLLGQLMGAGIALAVVRRQSPLKLAFNLTLFTLEACVAVFVFRSIIVLGDPLGAAGWFAAFTATHLVDIFTSCMVTGAISLTEGKPAQLPRIFGAGTLTTFTNTCVALVTVTVLWNRPASAWLLTALVVLIGLAYRAHGIVRRRHESLRILYESTRVAHGSLDTSSMLTVLLEQAREMLRADVAEVTLFGPDDEPALRTTRGPGEESSVMEPVRLDPLQGLWARVASEGQPVLLARPIRNEQLRAHFTERGLSDVIEAPLLGDQGVFGTMLVGNRLGDLSTFDDDDLRLFETLVNHASVSLENGRLIDSLREKAEENERLALHDVLTGLPNRALFQATVRQAIATSARDQFSFGVMLMDLNRFKEVNDTLGHHNGDQLLKEIALRLTEVLRERDLVARLGGDEFAILLADLANDEAARAAAAKILDALRDPLELQELTLDVGASLGMAIYPRDGADAETLLQRADVAMYLAKESHSGFELYSYDRDSYSPDRLSLSAELRAAIEQDDLTLVFQPKVDLKSGRVYGFEALARWYHPRHEFVPPDEFVPIAERTGLIKPLTSCVLSAALHRCALWAEQGDNVGVSVNVSARSLLDTAFPREVACLLRRWGVPASLLGLEITESSIMADPERSREVLSELSEMGVSLSIDDFGTGYSSLSHLKRLPVDEIKIDRSFVMGMARDENDAVIVRSTIELAHNLGLRVVAEGVETKNDLDRLGSWGCDVAQGYYLSRPLPIDRIREWSSSFQLLPGHDLPHSEQADIVPIGVRSLSN
jgi:diguanylate cyclase (GGDEF)-like protein